MVEPEILAKHLKAILELARDCSIQEIKIFGKHIGQDFQRQSGINFIVIPSQKMTTWDKRSFEQGVGRLVENRVQAYTPDEINELVDDLIATKEQAKHYLEKAVNIEAFIAGHTKKMTDSSSESSEEEAVVHDEVLAYLKQNETLWRAINQYPKVLANISSELNQKRLSVK